MNEQDLKKIAERDRKRDYRLRLKQSKETGQVLIRKREENKPETIKPKSSYKKKNPNPVLEKLQKHKIDYDGIINLMRLNDDDKRDTIKLYIDRIDRLFRGLFRVYLNTNNLNLLEKENEINLYLDDTYNTYIIKDGKPIKGDKDRNTLETYRSYINAILVITDRLGLTDIKRKYVKKSLELNKMYINSTDTNVLSTHENNNWISWNEITKLTDKTLKTTLLNPQEKIVAIIYNHFIAPRRIKDYQHMKIIKYTTRNQIPKHTLNKANQDLTNNYMIVSSNGLIRRIVFNQYKTKDTYGQIIVGNEQNDPANNYFYLEPSLVKELQPLIIDKNDGDYLLVNPSNNELYTQPQLTQYVEQIFKKITTKNLTCNMLRKIFITDNIVNNPKLSIEIKRNIGKYMGHSIRVQETYNRVMDGLTNDEIHIIRKGQFGKGEE
jgi:hypothetical protein